ncbi:MAG: ComF family protein [Herminiimonas sp.]|nr:ComF family protein [Herminiimonas sp.]
MTLRLSQRVLDGLPSLSATLGRLVRAALPASCALCGRDASDGLCAVCAARYFGQAAARCRQCGLAVMTSVTGVTGITVASARCGACLAHSPSFDATIVASEYAAPADQLVLGLKFGAQLALAPLLARLLRDSVLRADAEMQAHGLPELITAVPLGANRLASRGFNQALEIARPLSRALGIPLMPRLMLRLRDTLPQSRLSPAQRKHNVEHAFTLTPAGIDAVRGRHVGMVDDVMTTGDTLDEVAATLKRFGARRVTNLVFARTAPRPATVQDAYVANRRTACFT